jgi:hypothetical protein
MHPAVRVEPDRDHSYVTVTKRRWRVPIAPVGVRIVRSAGSVRDDGAAPTCGETRA